jgi:hypothetical protein
MKRISVMMRLYPLGIPEVGIARLCEENARLVSAIVSTWLGPNGADFRPVQEYTECDEILKNQLTNERIPRQLRCRFDFRIHALTIHRPCPLVRWCVENDVCYFFAKFL